MPNSLTPLAYSITEACQVSSIGKTRLYDLINEGRLKVTRIGRRTLVNAESLRALVEGNG
ncbi:helix-turn-helix domain-containing protein [Aurantiacibacter odishensis]|uniref:helix-turn-helix domain-containing protein n=1 Tax=Aurantiacibacter odishensis TaxID=1155476 RepID=UPI000E73C1A8|nr:helix-turn-helix domain-containing protein [Aurantiacibacter odishensis]